MATRSQKARSLEKAYEITKAYAGNAKATLSAVLEDVYKKLVELEEDIDKDN